MAKIKVKFLARVMTNDVDGNAVVYSAEQIAIITDETAKQLDASAEKTGVKYYEKVADVAEPVADKDADKKPTARTQKSESL